MNKPFIFITKDYYSFNNCWLVIRKVDGIEETLKRFSTFEEAKKWKDEFCKK